MARAELTPEDAQRLHPRSSYTEAVISLMRRSLVSVHGSHVAMTELTATLPVWGQADDYKKSKGALTQFLSSTSAPLPDDIVVISATHLRDHTFVVPDPDTVPVIVHGGKKNEYSLESQLVANHFMPLITWNAFRALGEPKSPVPLYKDMLFAAASRDNVVLVDIVRAGGDCFFHSVLVALHVHGVRWKMEAQVCSPKRSRHGINEEEEVCVECELCGVRVPESLFYKHVQIHRTRRAARPLDM